MPDKEVNDTGEGNGVALWEVLAVQEVTDCRIFTVDTIRTRKSDNGETGEFFRINSRDWVNVMAITDDDQLVMIRQFRHGSGEVTLEIPGGIMDDGESPLDAGLRELSEETGYALGDTTSAHIIGKVRSNPAIITNWTYFVLAEGVQPVRSQHGDRHEDIAVELRSVDEIDEMLYSGQVTHALVADAFLWYKLYLARENLTE